MSWATTRWLLQRVALLDSPLVMIAAIASLFTDRPMLAIVLAVASFALYMVGRGSLGLRHPPGDPRNPERLERPGRERGTSGRPPRERSRIRKTPL